MPHGAHARALYEHLEEMIGRRWEYYVVPAKTRIAFMGWAPPIYSETGVCRGGYHAESGCFALAFVPMNAYMGQNWSGE